MAVPTNTVQTYAQVGIREALSDTIYNISPMETPFVSGLKRPKATNTYEEWQIDALAAADENNAVVEGDDVAADSATATTRVGNYTQLMDKSVNTSSTARAVKTAGRKDELNYQVAKRGKELKRDIEKMALSINASVAGNSSTARKSAGVGAWLETNTNHGTGGSAGGFASGIVAAPTDGTNRALTETIFKTQIANVWAEGGDPRKVFCNASQKQKISSFSGIATQYRENKGMKQGTILGAADVYISDFGEHHIIPDRFAPTDVVYLIDPEYWELKELQRMKTEKLAKTGHAEKRLLSTEVVLCSKQEAASGGIFDLS